MGRARRTGVRLYVSPRPDGRVDDTAVDLGVIRDHTARLSRDLSDAIAAEDVRSIIVYCKVYAVHFGAASLTAT